MLERILTVFVAQLLSLDIKLISEMEAELIGTFCVNLHQLSQGSSMENKGQVWGILSKIGNTLRKLHTSYKLHRDDLKLSETIAQILIRSRL